MLETVHHAPSRHYVRIDEQLCNGCVLCMKVCPTKAIRVKNRALAAIEGVCIDCGECIRVCPRGAISAHTAGNAPIKKIKSVLTVSPVLYTQFGPGFAPSEVMTALKGMGFDDVYDQCETQEMFNVAMELYIRDTRDKPGVPRPLISPVCPVVMRLISYRFPSLLKHIPPIMPPREIAAREAKKRTAGRYGVAEKDVKVFYITPCAAKMIAIKDPLVVKHSHLYGAIAINTIYHELLKQLQKNTRDKSLPHESGIGIGWCMSGGEIAGMENGNFLAVSGMQETIRYLEKIEMGLLNEIDYVEFRTCAEGCIGGPLTVCDKYQARHTIQRFLRIFGPERTVKCQYLKQLYRKGWYLSDRRKGPPARRQTVGSFSAAIQRQESVESILQSLPGKECGACGAPDCRTFAEDVADGRAQVTACVFRKGFSRKGDRR